MRTSKAALSQILVLRFGSSELASHEKERASTNAGTKGQHPSPGPHWFVFETRYYALKKTKQLTQN